MNFNLKKYLMLSIAGLAVCSMQSNAMNSSSMNSSMYLNNYYNNDADQKWNRSFYSAEKIFSNPETRQFVNTDYVKQNLSESEILKFISGTILADQNNSAKLQQVMSNFRSFNQNSYNDDKLSQFLFLTTHSSNKENIVLSNDNALKNNMAKSRYSINPNVLNSVNNIFLLIDLVGTLKKCNMIIPRNVDLFGYENNTNNIIYSLAELLYSIKEYENFKWDILNGFIANLSTNKNDGCLGAILEKIMNTQSLYTTRDDMRNLIERFNVLFNKNENGIFSMTYNNKAHCVLSSFEKYNDTSEPDIEYVASLVRNYRLDVPLVIRWLNWIGFNGKLNYEDTVNVAAFFSLLDNKGQNYLLYWSRVAEYNSKEKLASAFFKLLQQKMNRMQQNVLFNKRQSQLLNDNYPENENEEEAKKKLEEEEKRKLEEEKRKLEEEKRKLEEEKRKLEEEEKRKLEEKNGIVDLEIPGLELNNGLKVVGISNSVNRPTDAVKVLKEPYMLATINSAITSKGKFALYFPDKKTADRSEFGQAMRKLQKQLQAVKKWDLSTEAVKVLGGSWGEKYLIFDVA